jgi:ornithine carbamoyltransferase
VLYTGVWVSVGEEKEKNRRIHAFEGFQISSGLLEVASENAVRMHCLPAPRDMETMDQVIEGKQSIVWQKYENKMYGAATALDHSIYGGKR